MSRSGNFSAPKAHELVVARGSYLELYRPTLEGRLELINRVNTFCIIRSISPVRLTDQPTDHLIVSSDSGKIVVLQYQNEINEWNTVISETYGKTGIRRIVPGQYLAKDPYGRAFMVAAVEKQKFVYVLSRDASNNMRISSPLEAHRSHSIVYDVVGLDNGYDNPLFATIEMDYEKADEDSTGIEAEETSKQLVYYELDLGTNTMVRKWATDVGPSAFLLVPVPGGVNGPGGVLVLCENWVLYTHNTMNGEILRTPVPHRAYADASRDVLLTACGTFTGRDGLYFALAQSELGDLFKITLTTNAADKKVTDLVVQYFDTIPVACDKSGLQITRNGLLFLSSGVGSHCLYQFTSLGSEDDPTAPKSQAVNADEMDEDAEIVCPPFLPRPLQNLKLLAEQTSLAPQVDFGPTTVTVEPTTNSQLHFNTTDPQFFALSGTGANASLQIVKQGIPINPITSTPLPGAPISVFTLPHPPSANQGADARATHKYILLSFANATATLSVGDNIKEVPESESGLFSTGPTLAVTMQPDGTYVQVHSKGVRVIKEVPGSAQKSISQWNPPTPTLQISHAVANERQVIIALSSGELRYFEYNPTTGGLSSRKTHSFGSSITALALPAIEEGRLRAPYVAVADSNNVVRILSLQENQLFSQLSIQALRTHASSLSIISFVVKGGFKPTATKSSLGQASTDVIQTFLYVGLVNGVLSRLTLSPGGTLSDPRSRYLGNKAVRLASVTMANKTALLALSSRTFISYAHGKQVVQVSVACLPYEHAATLSTADDPGMIIGISGKTLHFVHIREPEQVFTTETVPLDMTPRRFTVHETSDSIVIAEGAIGALSVGDAKKRIQAAQEENQEIYKAITASLPTLYLDEETTKGPGEDLPIEAVRSSLQYRAQEGEWNDMRRTGAPTDFSSSASQLRVVSRAALRALDDSSVEHYNVPTFILPLDRDELAISIQSVFFPIPYTTETGETQMINEEYVLVGTVTSLEMHPVSYTACHVLTFRVVRPNADSQSGFDTNPPAQLQFLHRTPITSGLPRAIVPFRNMALIGAGNTVELFSLGQKQLLRRGRYVGIPTSITTIRTVADRVFVADAQESVIILQYKSLENTFVLLVDDLEPKHVTAMLPLDYDTVAVGSKFGTLSILRVPPKLQANASDGSTDSMALTSTIEQSVGQFGVSVAPHKFVQIGSFYVGSPIVSLCKTTMAAGAEEILLYTTVSGAIGALCPIIRPEDVDFLAHLELYMKAEDVSLCGRDLVSFRSMYRPITVCALHSFPLSYQISLFLFFLCRMLSTVTCVNTIRNYLVRDRSNLLKI